MPLLHFFSTTADMPDLVWCESTNERDTEPPLTNLQPFGRLV